MIDCPPLTQCTTFVQQTQQRPYLNSLAKKKKAIIKMSPCHLINTRAMMRHSKCLKPSKTFNTAWRIFGGDRSSTKTFLFPVTSLLNCGIGHCFHFKSELRLSNLWVKTQQVIVDFVLYPPGAQGLELLLFFIIGLCCFEVLMLFLNPSMLCWLCVRV